MNLHIDTTDRKVIKIKLDDKVYSENSIKHKSQHLLEFIDQKLTQQKKTINDIRSITVNTDPGSFTGIRIGVSVANTIAWSLNIPVNGKKLLTLS